MQMAITRTPVREGDSPVISKSGYGGQITQTSPKPVQNHLLSLVAGLTGVRVRPSLTCATGSSGLHLAPKLAEGKVSAFLIGTEFAHVHPHYDGSLHLALPHDVAVVAESGGWGKIGLDDESILLYAPRHEVDLVVIWTFVAYSYRCARGLDPEAGEITRPP